MPNWLGDAVMATPVLYDLREKFPSASITAMIQSSISPLLLKDPHINELYSFSKPNGFIRRIEERQIIDRIEKGQYDVGFLLTNSFSSAWWFWRGGVKRRIGFKSDLRSLLLTDRVHFPKNRERQHLVDTYKSLLAPVGIKQSETKPYLFIAEEEKRQARSTLEQQEYRKEMILVGINPGAAYGPAKCWLPERFREVARLLLKNEKVFIVFFGDVKSQELIKKITLGLPTRVANLAGLTSLRELMALIQACDLFLTNDSGPMHIAAAFSVPLLALFGSTNDIVTGPYKSGKVIHKHVECSPCYLRNCPVDFQCMKRIEVEEVMESLKAMIDDATRNKKPRSV